MISLLKLSILFSLITALFPFNVNAERIRKKSERVVEVESVEPGIQTDPRSFSQIFESNLTESQTKFAESRTSYDMELSYVMNSIRESAIANDYYQLNLADQASSPPMLRVYAGFEALSVNRFFVSPFVGLGYAFQESAVLADSIRGGRYRDIVRLQWAPLFVGSKLGFRIPGWKGASVFAKGALSYDWISVAGNLDGITQSYWVPGGNLSLGGNFFEPEHTDLNAWFGGVSISGGVTQPLRTQGLGSNWLELGLRILL